MNISEVRHRRLLQTFVREIFQESVLKKFSKKCFKGACLRNVLSISMKCARNALELCFRELLQIRVSTKCSKDVLQRQVSRKSFKEVSYGNVSLVRFNEVR